MENTLQFEEWRPIEGYEGLYEVSTLGRVRSLDRTVRGQGEKTQNIKGRIIKPIKQRKGRCQIQLHKDGKIKHFMVHQLVARAFIPNDDPDHKNQVNHKDEDQSNNCVWNLEWCDAKYNINYGTGIERRSIPQRNNNRSRKVIQYTLDGDFIREWPSFMEIQRQLGFYNTFVCACCQGKHKQAYGFKWEYADNKKEIV